MTDDAALRVLNAHADRALTGPVQSPVEIAAVVAVERWALALGTIDAARIVDGLARPPQGLEPLRAELLDRVDAALDRQELGWRADAGLVNAEAGTHDVVRDAGLLRASVRAAEATFDQMPYYRIRYGARGSRWAAGDSTWLADLAEASVEDAQRNVEWLSRLLSARGMPSWLMELHLVELAERLVEFGGEPGPLAEVAQTLARQREAHVPASLMAEADAMADARCSAMPAPSGGALVAAAVADVAAGVVRHDGSLVGWFTDPVRTSPEDAEALLAVRDHVRAAVGR